MKIFSSIFLFLKKNRMPGLFNLWAVTQNKGRIQSPHRVALEEQISAFNPRVNSVCCLCGLVWPIDPGQGFTVRDNNSLSWLVAVFFCFFSPWTAKTYEEPKRLCVAGKKKTIIYYSNEMRSGRWWKRGRGLAAENLLLSTSVIPVSPWRNKKFKGNQRSWRVSLAYFQWATLEAEMGDFAGVSHAGTNQRMRRIHDTASFTICILHLVHTGRENFFLFQTRRGSVALIWVMWSTVQTLGSTKTQSFTFNFLLYLLTFGVRQVSKIPGLFLNSLDILEWVNGKRIFADFVRFILLQCQNILWKE